MPRPTRTETAIYHRAHRILVGAWPGVIPLSARTDRSVTMELHASPETVYRPKRGDPPISRRLSASGPMFEFSVTDAECRPGAVVVVPISPPFRGLFRYVRYFSVARKFCEGAITRAYTWDIDPAESMGRTPVRAGRRCVFGRRRDFSRLGADRSAFRSRMKKFWQLIGHAGEYDRARGRRALRLDSGAVCFTQTPIRAAALLLAFA